MTKPVSVDLACRLSLIRTENNLPICVQDRMVYNFKVMVDSSNDWISTEDEKPV
jgi:hypothetical protein